MICFCQQALEIGYHSNFSNIDYNSGFYKFSILTPGPHLPIVPGNWTPNQVLTNLAAENHPKYINAPLILQGLLGLTHKIYDIEGRITKKRNPLFAGDQHHGNRGRGK